MTELDGTTAIVTGASRGFGRGIAAALTAAGAHVIGVARTPGPLTEVAADAADPQVAADLLQKHRPAVVVLNAGAAPPMGPIDELTWAEFSRTWEVDTRQAFEWVRAALTLPLAPGSVVVAMSSAAALRGSPISGGYAGAKATIRFITAYASAESERRGLGLRFISVLPQLTPATDLGAAAVAAYAARQGVDVPTLVAGMPSILTPEQVGQRVAELIGDPAAPPEVQIP